MPLLPDDDGDGPTSLDIDSGFSQFPSSRLPALCFQSATFSYHPCNMRLQEYKCEAGSVSVTDDIARKLTAWYPETVRVTIRAGCVTSNP